MARATFEMDNLMPDWTDELDFGAFLNLPPDDVDQGVEDGSNSLVPNWPGHNPAAWNEAGHASDSMPNLCDERHVDLPWPSHNQILFDPSENAEASQSTNFQLQTNNASPGSGYGASNLYGDEIGASGCLRPASATVLKPTGSETIATGYCGEVRTTPSDQQASSSLSSDSASHEGSENHCACISCLKIRSRSGIQEIKCRFPGCLTAKVRIRDLLDHESSHYESLGKYKCLEQDCQTVTKYFDELKRHYKKHCTSPDKKIFSCPVLSCKYSGNNGFVRKDKLKSHYRNIHEGKPGPLKASRVIKPATLKPQVSSSGNSLGKQRE